MGFVELIKAKRDHTNEGQPQQDAIEDFPEGVGPYLAGAEGDFEKVQDDRQVCDLMREEPNYAQSSVSTTASQGTRDSMHTYSFIAAKFDEGVKKRANSCEAEGHSDGFGISSDENFDVVLKGLNDRRYHFLKVGIQEIRLLLVTFYLRKERVRSLSHSNPSRRAYDHSPLPPWNAVAATLIWSTRQVDPGLGLAKGGGEGSRGTIHASRTS